MKKVIIHEEANPDNHPRRALDEICRQGARRMLMQALEIEVAEYLEQQQEKCEGKALVTRHGYLPERSIQTGVGQLSVEQPRVYDRREGRRFYSNILPPYLRRLPSLDAVIPALYLRGVSTNDFSEALEALLGPQAVGLSPTNITRLKQIWESEYDDWGKRSLEGKRYVYLWADGIYFNVRLTPDRPCLLVLMGALEDGTKEILAILDGERESSLSWQEMFQNLKKRGFTLSPKALAVADGALGFWKALEETFPDVIHQRCWVHKTANVLNKLPKKVQPGAKQKLREIYWAEKREDADDAMDGFVKLYGARYPKACECLTKDRSQLLAFYDYPAEHWAHLRSTNPIESTFATVRHRTRQTKGCGSRKATLAMAFKLALAASGRWKRLRGAHLLSKVVSGVRFVDGEEKENLETAA